MNHSKTGMTTPKHSGDPAQFPAPSTSDATLTTGLSELAALARQAFEEKRRKNCLALARAILKIDPDNKEAQVIEGWVRSDLKHNLEMARAIAQDAHLKNQPPLYERAEMMVRALLEVDPEDESAKAFLSEVRASSPRSQTPTASAPVLTAPPVEPRTMPPVMQAPKPAAVPTAVPSAIPAATMESLEQRIRAEGSYNSPWFARLSGSKSKGLIAVFALATILIVWLFAKQQGLQETVGSESVTAGSTGVLSVSVDEGVQVLVNDEIRGTAPMEPLTLSPGRYHLRYKINDEEIATEDITVTAGNTVQNSMRQLVGRLMLIVVPASGVQLTLDDKPYGDVPPYLDVKPGEHHLRFTAEGHATENVSASVSAGGRDVLTVLLKPASKDGASQRGPTSSAAATSRTDGNRTAVSGSNNAPATLAAASAPEEPQPETVETGTLAINAALPVDIYDGGRLLGSTPATLELPAGSHTLEFRYGDMRKTATYTTRGGEKTTATVTFDVMVQINARPWAQVFVDGNPARALGQTPLGRTSVPIGSTLVFRNPSFPEKRYRVTAKDTAIQVIFP